MTAANTTINRRLGARVARATVISCALVLAGCSGDDVEFNGKIFDAIGMNQKAKTVEPKLAERAPLVMPPNPERVPEPGLPPEGQSADVAALQDPDAVAKTSRAELERQQAEYCKKNYEMAKAHGDDTTADLATGPLGPCRKSALTAIQQWQKGDDEAGDE